MPPGRSNLQVVRVWIDHTAPTGESERYGCHDGSTWIRRESSENLTGEQTGQLYGGTYIEPD